MKASERLFLEALEHITDAKREARFMSERNQECVSACDLAWAIVDRLRVGLVQDGKIERLDPFEELCRKYPGRNDDSQFLLIKSRQFEFGVVRWAARIIWDAALASKGEK